MPPIVMLSSISPSLHHIPIPLNGYVRGGLGWGKKFTAKISNTYLPLRFNWLATLFYSKQKLPSRENFCLEAAVRAIATCYSVGAKKLCSYYTISSPLNKSHAAAYRAMLCLVMRGLAVIAIRLPFLAESCSWQL